MEITILEKKDNPALSRTELELKLTFSESPTPPKEDLKKDISKLEKVSEDVVIVNGIYNSFGAGVASAQVTIYKSKADLERIEPNQKSKKGTEHESAAQDEAPAKEEEGAEEKADAPAEGTPDKEKSEDKKESADEKKE